MSRPRVPFVKLSRDSGAAVLCSRRSIGLERGGIEMLYKKINVELIVSPMKPRQWSRS